MATNAGTQPETEGPPSGGEEPAELAPEHLHLLQQLAAQRAARQHTPAAGLPDTRVVPTSGGDSEIEHLRRYVSVLEAAVAYLLNPQADNALDPAGRDIPAAERMTAPVRRDF